MSCISWNCRGLGTPRTVRALGDILREHKPKFLFLMETLSYANKIEEIRLKFGFDNGFSVDRIGRSGGLAVLWQDSINCQVAGFSNHHIDMLFSENNNIAWRLSCFYGYPERTRRRESWNLIRRLASISTLPWCIWGDFNDLMYPSDKKGKVAHPQYLYDGFCAAVNDCCLSELTLTGGKFTWERGRGTQAWVREKLDRGFATVSWETKFPLYKMKILQAPVSDHAPILMELLNPGISRKDFRFRFENIWLKEPNFVQEVSELWRTIPMTQLLPKISEVTSFMARWGRTFFYKIREKIKQHKANLTKLMDCTDANSVQEYLNEREKLNTLLLQEETYWKQRAKVFWLQEGDDNTRFFHASASAKKRANKVEFLHDDNGDKVEDQEGMCGIVREYFCKLFTEENNVTEMMNIISPRRVNAEQNSQLVEDLTFEEFTAAMKQMHPDKASGPDGLNPAFFQSFWTIMGREVFTQCKNWITARHFPEDLNSTNVVLIPKKENASCMKDLRPIALCNVLYRIMAKVLANRLKEVLPSLISENQSAFIKKRSITDNVLIAFEMIHHMNRKKQNSKDEVALKLDISKAYDRVSWSFLWQRMEAMGFCTEWIEWMKICVETVKYSFCLNGDLIGPVIPKKGLRQGDPLSPYLFLICAEGLSNAVDVASNNGEIHGCQISQTAPTISHLLFADDSFLFFQGNTEEATSIKNLLFKYEKWSGQSVNFQKSGVFYSSSVAQEKQQEISQILGVHNTITETKYLGLPSLVGRSKRRVFGYLKDSARKRIQGWQKKPMSQAGKTVLIRNVAQAIPTYSMSCFLIPQSICKELEQLFNSYWWRSHNGGTNKGLNWLSWNRMSMPKSKGGLGFRNLRGFNIALLGKHIWNFMQNPGLLVSRVFKGRYFPDTHVLKAEKGQGSSFLWSGIWTAKEELAAGFRWALGNGNDIVATKDSWLRGKTNFRVEQNELYEGRNEVVSSLFLPHEKKWNGPLIRNRFLPTDAEAILKVHIPQRTSVDRIVWTMSNNGIYSAKTAYHYWFNGKFGDNAVPQSIGWKRIWHLKLPNKIKVFIWRFCRNTIPVRNRLISRGINIPITCPMCDNDIEHMLHLFYDCSFANDCWNHVGLTYDWSTVESAPEWLINILSNSPTDEIVKVCVVLWGIWYWRNKKVWDTKQVTSVFAMDNSFRIYKEWLQAKEQQAPTTSLPSNINATPVRSVAKWQPPAMDNFKINVDASVFPNAQHYSVGMVLRNHEGIFIASKTCCFAGSVSVMEAEAMGILEALSWIKDRRMQHEMVLVETDSQLTVKAIQSTASNLLEVGDIIESCKELLDTLSRVSIRFIRKNANKVAHQVARIPCLVNSRTLFASPPTCLLEALAYDLLF